MITTAIRTRKVTSGGCTLFALLDESLSDLPERSVLVLSSKIVSLCEGRTRPIEGTDLTALVQEESTWYMPEVHAQHGYTFTIAHNMLTPNSGIDESNADGVYVLWPADPQRSANEVRAYLMKRFKRREVAVIITDSDFIPLRWGAIGLSVAYSGIAPLRSYRDRVDLFGRPLKLTRTDVVDSIEDIPDVQFVDQDPSAEELAAQHIPPTEDSFGPILGSVEWRAGGQQ